MYKVIVARRLRRAWQHLARGDYNYVLDGFATSFAHSFAGDHALGGERHGRKAQRAWFERLFRLLPGAEFTLEDVLVRGWPWRTRVIALLSVRATVAGHPYDNELVQTIDLRWGRITRIHTLEDTQKLAGALARLAAAGTAEAHTAPIVDRVWDPDAASAA